MATVVIRLRIITRFHVSKMDADSEERQRDFISRREKRWSMNSQRLEQIVAELMRPIGDLRRSFDTDLSALLEEYLTEAGLHALEDDGSPGPEPAVNFPELALLLQQSANIYGRKVDLLYQHVLECSESLHVNTETESAPHSDLSPATPHARRKRRASGGLGSGSGSGWARIALEPCSGSRREAELRPPPTLPRMYVDLEPRVLAPCDVPLRDYAGEPVGLLQDFNVTWRLHGGLLVDELECGSHAAAPPLRAIPLHELQAALEAAAPPSPPPAPPSPEPPDPGAPVCSTPIPTEEPPPPLDATPVVATPEPEPEVKPTPDETVVEAETAPKQQRKRKQEDPTLFQTGAGKIRLTPELRTFLLDKREFSLCGSWVSRVVAARCANVRATRKRLREETEITEFRGFDEVDKSDLVDIGGFLGWTALEVQLEATTTSLCLSRLASVAESDDDGFFEQSSCGSEHSRLENTPPPPTPPPMPPPPPEPTPPPAPPQAVDYSAEPEWMSWRAGVVSRASAGEARGLDVRALGASVLAALPTSEDGSADGQGPPTSFDTVLGAAAKDNGDVSRLFLATLFLANAGNVEVVQGPPLTLNTFSLRLVSRDESRYCAAADADPAFLTR